MIVCFLITQSMIAESMGMQILSKKYLFVVIYKHRQIGMYIIKIVNIHVLELKLFFHSERKNNSLSVSYALV